MKKCGEYFLKQNNIANRLIRKAKQLQWETVVKLHHRDGVTKGDSLILFDPSVSSSNLGDGIIRFYCNLALAELIEKRDVLYVPTHTIPSGDQLEAVRHGEIKIVCGTNLITPHYEEFSNWKMPQDLSGYHNILTLGVGWGYYCDDISRTSRFVYRNILSSKGIHSVRDSYTEKKFKEMGIHNVLNTGCPSIWGLTDEHCATIPTRKANSVVTTLTDYAPDIDADREMLSILKKTYGEVFVWIQGTGDYKYLKGITDISDVHIIEPNLDAYTAVLQSGKIDYVGTRLHAGIHALNYGVRTIILAVDNRATEMGRDFHLPVIQRAQIQEQLLPEIQSTLPVNISIPEENIQRWKKQFGEMN